ncbi:MAG: hypothetical protein RJQ09_02450 [Cyclobacteriaceae bacterium]
MSSTKDLILKYYNSWQEPVDLAEFRSCLDDNCTADMGMFQASNAGELMSVVRSNPTPWKNVELLDSTFSDDRGTIVYQGEDSLMGTKFRACESIEVKGGKIVKIVGLVGAVND